MPEDTPEQRCAHLLTIRNPGWEIVHDRSHQVYLAWRVENGRPTPPCLSDEEPSRLEARLRRPVDDVLTEHLRDAVYEMRDRGLLPRWHPGSDVHLDH